MKLIEMIGLGQVDIQLSALAHLLCQLFGAACPIAERTVAGLMQALEACADIFKPKDCENHFRACGYDTG